MILNAGSQTNTSITQGASAVSVSYDPASVYKETRPKDWAKMPKMQKDMVYMLVHIPDGVDSQISIKVVCNGSYYIETGESMDGSFVPVTSNTFSSSSTCLIDLTSENYTSITSDGMKQVLVKIGGLNITGFQLVSSSPSSYVSNGVFNIVEMACSLPVCSTFSISNSTSGFHTQNRLRYFTWHGQNQLRSTASMFSGCSSLIALLGLNMSSVTNASSMFSGCSSLIAIPELDMSCVTDASNMFENCTSLKLVPYLNTGAVENMSGMFKGCYSLEVFPHMSLESVTDASSMCESCVNIRHLRDLNFQVASNVSSIFKGCCGLKDIKNVLFTFASNASYAFYDCYNLLYIDGLDIGGRNGNSMNYIDFSYLFCYCRSLISIKNITFGQPQSIGGDSSSSYRYAFGLCRSLVNMQFSAPWGTTFVLNYCPMTYESIKTMVDNYNSDHSSLIFIDGTPGASMLTADDITNALSKHITLQYQS